MQRDVTHGYFTIERRYDAKPARVFAAWASLEAKKLWFGCDDTWVTEAFELNFRVGGVERIVVRPPGGHAHVNETVYRDIVENERIVYSCNMLIGDKRISVSIMTITFAEAGGGTLLSFTEQGAFLDGFDDVDGREEGTGAALDNLAKYLERQQ